MDGSLGLQDHKNFLFFAVEFQERFFELEFRTGIEQGLKVFIMIITLFVTSTLCILPIITINRKITFILSFNFVGGRKRVASFKIKIPICESNINVAEMFHIENAFGNMASEAVQGILLVVMADGELAREGQE